MSKKVRADVLLVERQLAESRALAQAMILAGEVFSGERRIDKPGETIPPDAPLRLTARKRCVVAVDVGKGQLAAKLRADPRVEVREGVNARDLRADDFDQVVDLVVVDASFIGIGHLVGPIATILRRGGGDLVALVKPQFEAGREAASRGRGVIRDPAVREKAIAGARASIEAAGMSVVAEIDSSVPGPKGNVERFVWARAPRC
jgi:23S rRNA (cytidine1920-2'-O)/16S rRNA (cytidine1409-2'-O)-methyltransferase